MFSHTEIKGGDLQFELNYLFKLVMDGDDVRDHLEKEIILNLLQYKLITFS